MEGAIWADFRGTAVRTLYAFAIAAVAGIPAGIVLGANRTIYRSVEFAIDFFRSTPATAMFPLFLLVFGIGEFSQVAVAAFAAWLVILFNVAYGVMNARQTRILAARVMGATTGQVFRHVMFFESLPQTFVGLRVGVSMALVVIIVAEMFIGSSNGMGRRIIDAQQVFDLAQMYASILVTGVLGYGLNVFFLALERHFVRWSGK
jgi:ABC-type nitrate/sulfonate/bicarbonate transport system permease component